MSPADRPAVPTVTSAPPGDLGPGWAEAVAGVLADPSRHRLAFQPVVDLQRGTVAGYEALSRFAGPPDAGRRLVRGPGGTGSAPSWTPGSWNGPSGCARNCPRTAS